MKHYVLLKFENGYLDTDRFQMIEDAFDEMKREIPGIVSAEVKRNSVDRGSNADVMISLELEDIDSLYIYLEHPLHVAFAGEIRPHTEKLISFDN